MLSAVRLHGLSLPLVLLFMASSFAQQTGTAQQESKSSETKSSSSAGDFYQVESLNQGIPELKSRPDRSTPLATVENFILACRDQDFQKAAHSLNFKLIPEDERSEAAEYARKFYYTLNQRLWIDIEELPDRPDGQPINRVGNKDPMAGKPRRSIRLGQIDIDDWKQVRVRLQRVQAGDQEPVWLFSAQTVEKIPALYQAYGPNWLEESIPAWAKSRVAGKVPVWEWVALVLYVAMGIAIGYAAQHFIGLMILHRQDSERKWFKRLIAALSVPIACAAAAFTIYLLKSATLSLTAPVNAVLDPLLLVMVVASVAWLVLRGLDVATSFTMDRYVNTLHDDEDGAEQGLLTKISVARRVATIVAVFAVTGIVLVQLNIFHTVGYGLLASAGVTTVILGIAAQPILGNLLSGLQIALTQPVRIGDSVLFEGNWGNVEDIKFTYLTIRTWDKRRLIVPLQYLLSKPIENWTKVNSNLTRPIKVYVDYTTDVDVIREKFQSMATQHELWDEESEPTVQVTNCSDESMEVRCLCHAKNPGDAWNLHCEMRERLISFVQELEGGRYLPRERVRMEGMEKEEMANSH